MFNRNISSSRYRMKAPCFKTLAQSQEQLKQAWDQAKDATATIKEEYKTPDGKTVTGYLQLTESLQSSLSFWANQYLPTFPEVHVPDSESSSSPRSKLQNTIHDGSDVSNDL